MSAMPIVLAGSRALGVDFGEVRIGLAITDELRMLAHPLMTLDARNPKVVRQIAQITLEKNVQDVVLGLPRNMDGSYGTAAEKVRAFATLLKQEIKCPLHLWDERWTTVAAQRALREAGKKTREYKGFVDQVAAQILLQSWVDAQSPSL
jgi:putative Holliday junction resolvase